MCRKSGRGWRSVMVATFMSQHRRVKDNCNQSVLESAKDRFELEVIKTEGLAG